VGKFAHGIALSADPGARIDVLHGDSLSVSRVVYSPVGTESGLPWIQGLEQLIGRGVSKDAWSDAAFYRGRSVAVIGSGCRAVEQALILADFGALPQIICPNTEMLCGCHRHRLQAAAIPVQQGVTVKGVERDSSGLLCELVTLNSFGSEERMAVSALFLAQGLACDWSIFEGVTREPFHPALAKIGLAGRNEGYPFDGSVCDDRALIE